MAPPDLAKPIAAIALDEQVLATMARCGWTMSDPLQR
jgi:hypothetical protein